MSTHQPPVRQSIVVEVPIEHAFKVFTEDFGSFKPREHNLLAVPIAETIFEPRVGGHVYDRGVDGSECRWARVLAYEPPNRLLLTWDISPQWQIETNPDRTSEWEVRLIAGPVLKSNIGISNAMAKAGRACAVALTAIKVGRCISGDSKIFLPAR